jgi:hypothetical protein
LTLSTGLAMKEVTRPEKEAARDRWTREGLGLPDRAGKCSWLRAQLLLLNATAFITAYSHTGTVMV